MTLEIDQLQIMKGILETGSVSKTAIKLQRSKSVVSRELASLEEECGQLFHRNGRGLVLTELGESILPHVDLILSTAKGIAQFKMEKKVAALEEVRLAITPAVGGLLPHLFDNLRQTHPLIRLHLTEVSSADAINALEDNRVDVAVFLRPGTSMRRSDEAIAELDTYLVGPADDPVMQQDEIAFTALDGLPLLMPGPPSLCRRFFDLTAASKGVKLTVVANANALGPTMYLLRAGKAYLVTPTWPGAREPLSLIDAEIRAGRLRAVRIVKPRYPRKLVVRAGVDASPAVEMVAQHTAKVLLEARG
jgi:DNA-binding transcriptional LysR family regulator